MNNKSRSHVLYPVGHHASGKTELCGHLIDRYGFAVVETGALVRAEYARRSERRQAMHIGEFVTDVEREEPEYFLNLTMQGVRRALAQNDATATGGGVIVNGMRSRRHLDALRERLADHQQTVLWIESPLDQLKPRWEAREGRQLSDAEFRELLNFDSRLGLDEIRSVADVTIVNDGSIAELQQRADAVLRHLGGVALQDVGE